MGLSLAALRAAEAPLQVYMYSLPIRSRWRRSTFDAFSTKPRHKKGGNTESLRFTILWDIHFSNFFSKKIGYICSSKTGGPKFQ